MIQTNIKYSNKSSSTDKVKSIVSIYNKIWIKRLITFILILFCIVFSICFLYKPAKDFYINIREHDKLQAQYDAIKLTNDRLENDIDYLQTDEGIKQRANETLGLIEQGESSGVVIGLDNETNECEGSISNTSSRLAYKNIKTPKTWYSDFCNYIFEVYD